MCRVQPRICTTPTHNTHIGISTLPPSIPSRRLPCLCDRLPHTPIYPANPELEAPHFRDSVSLHNASYNNPSIPQSFNAHKITRNLKSLMSAVTRRNALLIPPISCAMRGTAIPGVKILMASERFAALSVRILISQIPWFKAHSKAHSFKSRGLQESQQESESPNSFDSTEQTPK